MSQAENVAWMGWRPARVTHSSDYFPALYDYAVRCVALCCVEFCIAQSRPTFSQTRCCNTDVNAHHFQVELIKRDKAYVCHQTKDEMEASRDIARVSY